MRWSTLRDSCYRHYDLNYGRRYGDGLNANGVECLPIVPLVKANIDPVYFRRCSLLTAFYWINHTAVGNVLNVISRGVKVS